MAGNHGIRRSLLLIGCGALAMWLIGLALSDGGSAPRSPTPTATPQATATPPPALPTATPQPPPVTPTTIEGHGTETTDPFALEAATYRVQASVTGNTSTYGNADNFVVRLHSLSSGEKQLLVNEIAVSGAWSKPVPIGAGHRLFLEVDASGAWAVTFEPIQ